MEFRCDGGRSLSAGGNGRRPEKEEGASTAPPQGSPGCQAYPGWGDAQLFGMPLLLLMSSSPWERFFLDRNGSRPGSRADIQVLPGSEVINTEGPRSRLMVFATRKCFYDVHVIPRDGSTGSPDPCEQ